MLQKAWRIGKCYSFLLMVFLGFSLLLTGCKPTTNANFQNLYLPSTPTYFLLCPRGYCNVTPTAYSPVYSLPADELFNQWNEVIAKQTRVSYLYNIPEQGEYILMQRSPVLGLPDDITVQFIALSDTQSTLAILSRSRYGFYDFGSNRRRIESWIQQLNQQVQQAQNTSGM